MNYDVIVIGAGLAGLMAAEAAREGGARVLLLARGMGSLPLMSGCIDGLGYLPSTSPFPLSSPLAQLVSLKERQSHHPYALLGGEKIITALSHFQEITRTNGVPYVGHFNSNVFLPTSLGTFRPTCLLPETMLKGNLSLPGAVLLLGFEGLKDFSPLVAAENLNLLHSQGKVAPTFRAEHVGGPDLRGKAMNRLNLAKTFGEEDFRERFVRQVKPLLQKGERLGLPAVLGFPFSEKVWSDLQDKLSAEIFEIPTSPPSIPGLRLYRLLRTHLQRMGVRLVVGLSLLKPIIGDGRIQGIYLGDSKKSTLYRASAFILATGKFVGGGLDSQRERVYETFLNLPVKHPSNRKDWAFPHLLASEGHPFNSFGVEVNESLQPVDAGGKVIYANLFAAGGILAHADSMAEKSGGGVAISTGYWAGIYAAKTK